MKKLILFLSILIFPFSFINAQFKILNAYDKSTVTNDTIWVFGDATSEMSLNLWVVNSGVLPITLYARRDSISLPMNVYDNSICWAGTCYDTNANVSVYTETIAIGDTSNTSLTPAFSGHYFPYGHIGLATLRYTFYSSANHADSNWVLVHYDATPAAIATVQKSVNFSAIYPNPASNKVNFTYSVAVNTQTANLKIFNLLGECIQTMPLNTAKNKTSINVQNMHSGVYVCEIEASGCKPSYQKLIVAH